MAARPAPQLQGQLQLEIMKALWKLGRAGVEDVRAQLPEGRRSAYTTVQTVLNRLAERGLLERERNGRSILYSAKVSEADYYARSLRRSLDRASGEARRVALAHLVAELPAAERSEIEQLAREVAERGERRK